MTCCGATAIPDETDLKQRLDRERLLAAAHPSGEDCLQSDFLVPGMHCAACIGTIERGLGIIQGVKSVRANLSTRRVSVNWNPEEAPDINFIDAMQDLGFEVSLFDLAHLSEPRDTEGRRLLLSLAVAGFAAANIMLLSVSVWSGADAETAHLFHLISGLIAVPAVLFAGRPFFSSAVSALKVRRLNMDVPISLAVLLALALSFYESLTGGSEAYFDASVTLLFFLLIGRTLDHMMRERARGAVTRLARLAPSGATVKTHDGSFAYRPLAEIGPGDELIVAAGERIPVDGRVIAGRSDIDRSLVTGESAPDLAEAGRELEAGTLNLSGPLNLRALRAADHSFIAEIVQMMEAAEKGKSGYVRLADRAATIYAPVVHLLAAASFVLWMILTGGDWSVAVPIAIAVLIITCPCALGLAVPIAHVVAANRLLKLGIPVKDGAALEKFAHVDIAVFDKTGTLTTGTPELVAVDGGTDRDRSIAAALAAQSTHPLARAVASTKTIGATANLDAVEEHPGFGMEALWSGQSVRLGRNEWVAAIASNAETDPLHADSAVAFARAGGPLFRYAVRDHLRDEAKGTIDTLRNAGLGLEILSGDRSGPVAATAAAVGIDHALAGLAPAEKIARIEALRDEGKRVLYVGDGLNDAPALAAAHVSIAPASGSDIGRMSADYVLTGTSLRPIADALILARRTGMVVKQNFGLAIAYNCIAIPIAVSGYASPLVAAIAMSASSIVVVANSFRLGTGGMAQPNRRSGQPGSAVQPATMTSAIQGSAS
ncbi:MAG: heavy metal translocating P-type ATPase [Pseudomonadota bacterium]